ncbi:hypothetical protein EDEG_02870 [Edhazardia aedis USNM 41457]|uniref:SPX domain-containing protein n=1 Tax=Edhazardia aedis (strain USNM 41457) TaxID=1003232 RepID=J9D4J9_EDHAE|nr:hypothetical protein EDEG_02870 [Edhazardia aedis USNM 41457]|eukprot:EJW02731.1 hypothetical protein EDEG_02870 [Edhazardia aedis USNM 41457]
MKFYRTLEKGQVNEWKDRYIDYVYLKQLIKTNPSLFFRELKKNADKIDEFYFGLEREITNARDKVFSLFRNRLKDKIKSDSECFDNFTEPANNNEEYCEAGGFARKSSIGNYDLCGPDEYSSDSMDSANLNSKKNQSCIAAFHGDVEDKVADKKFKNLDQKKDFECLESTFIDIDDKNSIEDVNEEIKYEHESTGNSYKHEFDQKVKNISFNNTNIEKNGQNEIHKKVKAVDLEGNKVDAQTEFRNKKVIESRENADADNQLKSQHTYDYDEYLKNDGKNGKKNSYISEKLAEKNEQKTENNRLLKIPRNLKDVSQMQQNNNKKNFYETKNISASKESVYFEGFDSKNLFNKKPFENIETSDYSKRRCVESVQNKDYHAYIDEREELYMKYRRNYNDSNNNFLNDNFEDRFCNNISFGDHRNAYKNVLNDNFVANTQIQEKINTENVEKTSPNNTKKLHSLDDQAIDRKNTKSSWPNRISRKWDLIAKLNPLSEKHMRYKKGKLCQLIMDCQKLIEYSRLNFVGFQKILKKFDKKIAKLFQKI